MNDLTYSNPLVRRLNRKQAAWRIYHALAPWAIACGFVASYGFMAWLGRP